MRTDSLLFLTRADTKIRAFWLRNDLLIEAVAVVADASLNPRTHVPAQLTCLLRFRVSDVFFSDRMKGENSSEFE
jgi:hypothetical protein